ncbi:MAG: glucose-6-phosphate dehydrogenase [Gemmatimonadales bacterium]
MTGTLAVPLRIPEQLAASPRPIKRGEPCTMVILGAGGDLARRKLIPSLFHLMRDGLLPDDFSIVGVARGPMTDGSFREAMHAALAEFGESGAPEEATWSRFAERLVAVSGDLSDPATYGAMGKSLAALERGSRTERGRLFYLALPPSTYRAAIVHLSESGLAQRLADPERRPWVRIIVEKPFGRDLESARALNQMIAERFAEHQVYRIDHYLGKEAVQNLLVFRFANSIFEPVWNRDHVHHVQITAAESVGVEHRAGYYEEAGVVRDMFQNHLLQLLALTAMEPPATFRADAVRDEKAKVLAAIRPVPADEIDRCAVRGQYGPGLIGGERVPGYRDEERVAPGSTTPTYAALRLVIDNWRWQGVPFFLRSGKRMPRRVSEIAIQFRRPPHVMFPPAAGQSIPPNVLAFRIQPDEGISLCLEVKVPDITLRLATANMDFSYAERFGPSGHSAYETLLLDCMRGDATLFARSDAVEAAWRVVDPFIEAWERRGREDLPFYAAGGWGPAVADELVGRDGATWRTP